MIDSEGPSHSSQELKKTSHIHAVLFQWALSYESMRKRSSNEMEYAGQIDQMKQYDYRLWNLLNECSVHRQ